MSARPMEYPATTWAIRMICSWYTISPYVSARTSRSGSSSSGWIGVMGWRPFLRSA